MSSTRRVFLKHVVATGGAVAGAAAVGAPLAALQSLSVTASQDLTKATMARMPAAAPVVAFFFDGQLWLDPSGASTAYEPPSGARGAAALAALSDEHLFAAGVYI